MKNWAFFGALLVWCGLGVAQTAAPKTAPSPLGLVRIAGEKAPPLEALAVSPGGRWLASASRETLILWSVATAKPLGIFAPPDATAPFEKLLVARSANVLVAQDDDHTLFFYDITKRRLQSQIKVGGSFYEWGVSADGKKVAIAGDKGVELRDSTSGALLKTLQIPGSSALQIEFSDAGTHLVILARPAKGEGQNATVHWFDLTTGKTLKKVSLGGFLSTIALAPDGKSFAAAWEGTGRVYALPSMQITAKLGPNEETGEVPGFLWCDKKGRIWTENADLVSGSTSQLAAFEAKTGKRLTALPFKQSIFEDGGFAGNLFIARDESGQIRFTDVVSKRELVAVSLVAFENGEALWLQKRPDGKWSAPLTALPYLRWNTGAAEPLAAEKSPQFETNLIWGAAPKPR